MIKKYIKRPHYLAKIEPFIDKDIIKVLVGQRRVGKSYMLFQIMDLIKGKHDKAPIIYINKELHEFDDILDYKDLLTNIEARTDRRRKRNYVFIDEIQEITNFEKCLRSLKASGKYDIYCTGSNSKLLSGELASFLSGRCIEITIHGLSYPEFLTFHKLNDTRESFLMYIKYGGLPYLIHLKLEDAIVYDYIKNVCNTILFKDVIKRHQIRNVAFLEALVEYLADNIGSIVSAKKISDFLKSQRINISPNMVLDYLSYLEEAFFIHEVPRAEVRGKKIFEINDKYYFEDLGLRHSIVGYKPGDISKVLENVVYTHLVSAGYEVTVGQLANKEIDFVCERQGEKQYIQVAYLINEENKEREFNNLLAIPDNFTKIVVSMDELLADTTYKGVKHMSIRNLLTS